jgi:hypothetical protein
VELNHSATGNPGLCCSLEEKDGKLRPWRYSGWWNLDLTLHWGPPQLITQSVIGSYCCRHCLVLISSTQSGDGESSFGEHPLKWSTGPEPASPLS